MLQIIIAVLTVGLLAACRGWATLRQWCMCGGVRWLIGLHATRVVAGLAFLWFYARGRLPREFAVPGGIGDIVVGTLAMGLCLRPRGWPILAWNALGLLDILGVVANAARCGLSDPASMAELARLPLSLLPAFLVPLIIATHVLLFVRLKAAPGRVRPGAAD